MNSKGNQKVPAQSQLDLIRCYFLSLFRLVTNLLRMRTHTHQDPTLL